MCIYCLSDGNSAFLRSYRFRAWGNLGLLCLDEDRITEGNKCLAGKRQAPPLSASDVEDINEQSQRRLTTNEIKAKHDDKMDSAKRRAKYIREQLCKNEIGLLYVEPPVKAAMVTSPEAFFRDDARVDSWAAPPLTLLWNGFI